MTDFFRPLVTDNPLGALNDILMAKCMAEWLTAAYPGYGWAVTFDTKAGVCDVRAMALSGRWGFRMLTAGIYSISSFKRDVLKAGGEILERYRVRRGKVRQDEYENLPVDFAGRIVVDAS